MRRIALLALLPLAAVVAMLPAAGAVPACDTQWAAAVSGDWDDASKWTSGVPDAGKDACITVTGTYTVTVDNNASARTIQVGGATGTQTVEIAEPLGQTVELSLGSGVNEASLISDNGVIRLTGAGTAILGGGDNGTPLVNHGVIRSIGTVGEARLNAAVENAADGEVAFENGGCLCLRIFRNLGAVSVGAGEQLVTVNSVEQAGGTWVNGGWTRVQGGSYKHTAGTVSGNQTEICDASLDASGSGSATYDVHKIESSGCAGNAVTLAGNIGAGITVRLRNTGQATLDAQGPVGGLTIGGTLTMEGDSTAASNRRVLLGGPGVTVASGGKLTVSGLGQRVIQPALTNSGTLDLDRAVTLDSTYTQTASGTFDTRVAGLDPAQSLGRLAAAGSVALDGALRVTTTIASAGTLDIVTGASRSGQFGVPTFVGPAWTVNYTATAVQLVGTGEGADSDGDGVPTANDNCPSAPNANQTNTDGDSQGDACDADDDNDGAADNADNCPLASNADQADSDNDGVGNVCDGDADNDTVPDASDNCPSVSNQNQQNTDGDSQGNACDADDDNDGDLDGADNCPTDSNADQSNLDSDAQGDLCDSDDDGDGDPDNADNCPTVANPDQADADADGKGDLCDGDRDQDGVPDQADNCPDVSNGDQGNLDGDSQGDACDPDDDNDGAADSSDNCPRDANADQADSDKDGKGNVCDAATDSDGDGVLDASDNCPTTANSSQANTDGDSEGNACDDDDDGDGFVDGADNCPQRRGSEPDGCPFDPRGIWWNQTEDVADRNVVLFQAGGFIDSWEIKTVDEEGRFTGTTGMDLALRDGRVTEEPGRTAISVQIPVECVLLCHRIFSCGKACEFGFGQVTYGSFTGRVERNLRDVAGVKTSYSVVGRLQIGTQRPFEIDGRRRASLEMLRAYTLPPQLPEPKKGVTASVEPVQGRLQVIVAGSNGGSGAAVARPSRQRLRPLTRIRRIPIGSTLDTRRGVVRLVTAGRRAGTTREAYVSRGLFRLRQGRRGNAIAEARLVRGSFGRCRAKRRDVVRELFVRSRDAFRSRGRDAAATGQGRASWIVQDRCDGTFVGVSSGRVLVKNLRTGRTRRVGPGRYLIRHR